MTFKPFAVAAISIVAIVSCCPKTGNGTAVYLDGTKDLEERVEDAFSRLTLEEKVAMLHAQSKFSSAGVPRLGIPELWCTDGPHGIRAEVLWDEWDQAGWTNDSITAYPALTALAATWNRDMAHLYGHSIGEEAAYRKKNVLLGPGVNICRTPLGGRNFEYMGEDPYLAGEMAVPYIKGTQELGVAVCLKHFALNNNEYFRSNLNVNVDDRTLYEIYLPAFKKAVQEGGAWSVMAAYNLYKDQFLCSNEYLLKNILKDEWGFDGVVISDWGGVHNTLQTARNGLDLEYGTWTNGLTEGRSNAYDSYFLAAPYLEAINAGEIGTEELDDKARRILRLQMRTNLNPNKSLGNLDYGTHFAAARKIGGEGIVLLKNEENVLPVPEDAKILVVGENAIKMMTVGGGSSSLKTKEEVLPLEGIQARFSNVSYERGYVGSLDDSYNGVSTGQSLAVTETPEQLIASAVKAAQDVDYIIFIGGLNKSDFQDCEGTDRRHLELPYNQDLVIEALASLGKKLVVVNISGNAVAMPWINQVQAVLQGWYLGSQAGNALADVLSGDVNPSGKLPFTFPKSLADGPIKTQEQLPGIWHEGKFVDGMPVMDVYYTEGIFVGYRWFEHENIEPLFAFGHGLSYTTFEYSNAKISSSTLKQNGKLTVSVDVTNTGSRAGAEVVQLYVSDKEASVERPEKELKGFDKVYLAPGETKTVSLQIDTEALSFFDADAHKWVAEPGDYEAIIAAAADNVKAVLPFTLK